MNPLLMKGLAGLALLVAGYFYAFGRGEASMKAEWDADNALRTKAENAAILQRAAENKALAETQAETNRLITRSKDAELTKIRADIAGAPRMRIGQSLCGGPAAAAETSSAGGGNGADSGGRLVREDAQRDLDALKLKVEEAFATGRAAQSFIRDNGLAP